MAAIRAGAVAACAHRMTSALSALSKRRGVGRAVKPARPMQREPSSDGDGNEGDERRQTTLTPASVIGAGNGRPRIQEAPEAARLGRHRAAASRQNAGIEQVGAVGKQAIGKQLPAAGIDAVGEFVGASRQEPRLLQRPVDLALRGGETAALGCNGGILGATPGAGAAPSCARRSVISLRRGSSVAA